MDKKANQEQVLFRFTTLRAPELINQEKKHYNFVEHPDGLGQFATRVANRPSGETVQEAMLDAAETFTAKSVIDLQTAYPNLWQAAQWITRHKYNFSADEVIQRIHPLAPFSTADCWDNLFYQIIKQTNYYAKDLVMELLVLNQLLEHHRDMPEADFKEHLASMMMATVVLPLDLFPEEHEFNAPQERGVGRGPLFSTKDLRKSMEVMLAKSGISTFRTAIAEVEKMLLAYETSYSEKYQDALRRYDVLVKDAYAAATVVPKKEIDCPSGCEITYYEYQNLVLPTFDFKVPTQIGEDTLYEELSEESYFAVVSLGLEKETTFDPILRGLEAALEKANNQFYANLPAGESIVSVGAMMFRANSNSGAASITSGEVPFTIYFETVSQSQTTTKGKVLAVFELGYPDSEVLSAQYTATLPDSTEISGSEFIDSPNGFMLNTTLFSPTFLEIPVAHQTFSLTATLVLGDGSTLTFTVDVPVKQRMLEIGVATLTSGNSSDHTSPFIPSKFGIRRLGIEDYKKVVTEVCCYKEAEVSNIINIMQGEFLSRTTTRERIEETTTTTERSTEKENLTDTTTSERFEMQTEIAKILQQDREKTAYANVTAHGDKWRLEAGGTYAASNSKEESNRQAVTEATELTQRAMERIVTKFREEVVTKITESFKEENSHIYDNRTGTGHISGVYRYINAIYKNQIFNYGKRLMYEFMIPEPSRIFRKGMDIGSATTTVNDNDTIMHPPVDPVSLGINSAEDIDQLNFRSLAARYRAEVENPPSATLTIGKSFHGNGNKGSFASEYELKIPEHYKVKKIEYAYSTRASNQNPNYNLIIGNTDVLIVPSAINQKGSPKSGSETILYPYAFDYESVPVTITGWDLGAFSVNLKCTLERTPQAYADWQIKTYDAISRAYHDRLAEFENQAVEVQNDGVNMLQANPLFYREIERITLKRNCISYLQPINYFGRTLYAGTSFEDLRVDQTPELDEYASHAKFMEQAFEWDIMSYNFYPYYWGEDGQWKTLYQTEYDDPLFKSFMQSGMARVIVSVRPGFEKAVMHYMNFGGIWDGGEMPVIGDPLYLGIVEELKEPEYTVEETWETVVPTSLIGIQRDGVLVNEGGLPCGGGCEGDAESKLVEDTNKLEPPITPSNPN